MKTRAAAVLAAVLFLSGCAVSIGSGGQDVRSGSESQSQEEQPDTSREAEEEENNIPGSWTVPEGWVLAQRYSTKNKVFDVEEGHEEDSQPDNISVEVGTNRYSAGDHEQFREAILRQLLMQVQGLDAELTGDGTFTEQEYVLYIFTITEPDVITKQFYIIGDQRYGLVHLTNFTGSEATDEAAQAIADSFVWDGPED